MAYPAEQWPFQAPIHVPLGDREWKAGDILSVSFQEYDVIDVIHVVPEGNMAVLVKHRRSYFERQRPFDDWHAVKRNRGCDRCSATGGRSEVRE